MYYYELKDKVEDILGYNTSGLSLIRTIKELVIKIEEKDELINFYKNETEKQKKNMLQAYKERDYWKEEKHKKDREMRKYKKMSKYLSQISFV